MITVTERLKELGYTLPPVVKPLAAYVPAMRVGNQVWTSGQLPVVDGQVQFPGKVGVAVSQEQAIQAARICALNAIAAAGSVAGGVDNIERIVKATIFVASDPSFTAQPKVGNGASELLAMVFGGNGQHVRSAVGVASLPLDAPVELELVVEIREPEQAEAPEETRAPVHT